MRRNCRVAQIGKWQRIDHKRGFRRAVSIRGPGIVRCRLLQQNCAAQSIQQLQVCEISNVVSVLQPLFCEHTGATLTVLFVPIEVDSVAGQSEPRDILCGPVHVDPGHLSRLGDALVHQAVGIDLTIGSGAVAARHECKDHGNDSLVNECVRQI